MSFPKGQPATFATSFVFVLGMSCGGTQPQDPTPPVTVPAASPSATTSSSAMGPAENLPPEKPHDAAKPSRCAPDGYFPAMAPEPAPAEPLPCRPAEEAAEKTAAKELKAQYRPTMAQSKVEVKFGCDGLDKVISRIVLEMGGGHGGAFHIIEISRPEPNAATYDVMGIRVNATSFIRPKFPFEIARSTLPQEALFAWMPVVRAALRATIEEVPPKHDPKARTGSGSAFGSSSNFHVLVRLEDTAGRRLERQYTGYEGSAGQANYLPPQRARAELEQALAGATWHADAPPDEFKRFFDRRFVDAQKRFSDPSTWWVREHYAKLAADFGTRALIPSLLPLLTPSAGDVSGARVRDQAFGVLVALTGWDPRAPKNGEHPRTIEAAAGDFVEECGKVPVKR